MISSPTTCGEAYHWHRKEEEGFAHPTKFSTHHHKTVIHVTTRDNPAMLAACELHTPTLSSTIPIALIESNYSWRSFLYTKCCEKFSTL